MTWLHWALICIIWLLAVLLIGAFLGFDRADEDEGDEGDEGNEGAEVSRGRNAPEPRARHRPAVPASVSARMARRWRERVAGAAWWHRRLEARRGRRR
ncbi:MAG: hypothetical protein QM674_08765 [Burkholderiaceae bacterium]